MGTLVKANQEFFHETEVAQLTAIPVKELRSLARTRRLGILPSDSAGGERIFRASDLAIISFLQSHKKKSH